MNPLPDLNSDRCVIYRRVSSAEQERASGPKRQRKACERFAAARGLEVVADRFEDLSGTLPMAERPGLSGALTDCLERGAGVLLVEERTRLARDEYAAHDALRTFAHAGVRVLYADGSNGGSGGEASEPAAMLLDAIGHSVAAYDRRVIVARMAAGRRAKAEREPRSRAQGGRLPYGYRRTRSGGVEVEEEAAAQVRRAFELVRGGKTLRGAAAELGWHPTMLARMLKRVEYKQAGDWRIVDPRVWNAAQEALAGRRPPQAPQARCGLVRRGLNEARATREQPCGCACLAFPYRDLLAVGFCTQDVPDLVVVVGLREPLDDVLSAGLACAFGLSVDACEQGGGDAECEVGCGGRHRGPTVAVGGDAVGCACTRAVNVSHVPVSRRGSVLCFGGSLETIGSLTLSGSVGMVSDRGGRRQLRRH